MVIKLANLFNVTTNYLLNNCNYRINYSKILNRKLSEDMTVERAVSVILNALNADKGIFTGVIKMMECQQKTIISNCLIYICSIQFGL